MLKLLIKIITGCFTQSSNDKVEREGGGGGEGGRGNCLKSLFVFYFFKQNVLYRNFNTQIPRNIEQQLDRMELLNKRNEPLPVQIDTRQFTTRRQFCATHD